MCYHYLCVCTCTHTCLGWQVEVRGQLLELILSFHHADSKVQVHVTSFIKFLYLQVSRGREEKSGEGQADFSLGWTQAADSINGRLNPITPSLHLSQPPFSPPLVTPAGTGLFPEALATLRLLHSWFSIVQSRIRACAALTPGGEM